MASGRSGGGWLWFALGGAALLALIVYLADRYPGSLSDRESQVSMVHLVLFGALVASGLLLGRRLGLGYAVRTAAIWLALGLALVLGYSYRFELAAIKDRVLGELLPHRAEEVEGGALRFRAAADGHFYIEARVEGRPVRFMVDTGASDIVLSLADAARIGLDPARLAFTRRYRTANGTVRGAPVRLGEIRIGSLRLRDVPASVNEAEMGVSLLGMRFLNLFARYEVRRGTLLLYPK